MTKTMKPIISAELVIKEEDGDEWKLWVDSDGGVEIEAPCGHKVRVVPGRKGKFFKDMLKSYEVCAKAANLYDTDEEIRVEKKPVSVENPIVNCCAECSTYPCIC